VLPLRQWQATHLFRAWVVYWVGLLAVVAWRPLMEYWRITRSPSGHGSVGYTYSGGLLPLTLWIAGPPLVLFAIWLATRTGVPEKSRGERLNG
jgi:hypothetical protein